MRKKIWNFLKNIRKFWENLLHYMHIKLFRALIGARSDKTDLFNGVIDLELKEKGLLTSNHSSMQTKGEGRRRSLFYHSENRKVVGLPVFLSESEAKWWASCRKYNKDSLPAIAVVDLPIKFVENGVIKIFKNTLNEHGDGDIKISASELLNPPNERPWKGEFYISGDLARLRDFESILRPDGQSEGKVSSGWHKTEIANTNVEVEGKRIS